MRGTWRSCGGSDGRLVGGLPATGKIAACTTCHRDKGSIRPDGKPAPFREWEEVTTTLGENKIMSWYWKVKNCKDYTELLKMLADEIENLSYRMTTVQTELLKVQKAIVAVSEGNLKANDIDTQCKGEYREGPPQEFYLAIPVAPPRLEIHWQNWPRATNKSEVREIWNNLVHVACRKAKSYPVNPIQKFIAVFRFNYGDNAVRDVDNYAIKFIIDALAECNIIVGDDSNRMSLFITSAYGERWETEILIYETSNFDEIPSGLILEMEMMRKIDQNIDNQQEPSIGP